MLKDVANIVHRLTTSKCFSNYFQQNDNIMDKTLILSRIKTEKKFKTDTELANFLGISRAVLSNWYKRNTLDYELVLSKCEHLDFNKLLKENNEEIKSEEKIEIPVKIVDNDSFSFIMDRYEVLAVENGYLKKENEDLKQSRGKHIDATPYTENSPELSTSIASEPAYE